MSAGYEPAEGLVWRPLDDGLVLLDSVRGLYFELNASGRAMFEGLCEGQSRSQILDALGEQFEASREQLAGDLDALCQQLLTQGLLRRTS